MSILRNPDTGYGAQVNDGKTGEIQVQGLSPSTLDSAIRTAMAGVNQPINFQPTATLTTQTTEEQSESDFQPQLDVFAQMAAIVTRWITGDLKGKDAATVLQVIQREITGGNASEALNLFNSIKSELVGITGLADVLSGVGAGGGAGIGSGVSQTPTSTRTPGDTGSVPKSEPFSTGRPDPSQIFGTGPQSRADLFRKQNDTDLAIRLKANVFGTRFSPTANRAANATIGRFEDLDPFLAFLNPQQSTEERLRGLVSGGTPSPDILAQTLQQLIGSATSNPDDFELQVPDFMTAATLALQPQLANIDPRLSDRLQQNILSDLQIRMTQQPENFQNPTIENLLTQIEEFKQRGFLTNAPPISAASIPGSTRTF